MILDISDSSFRHIMNEPILALPKSRQKEDFLEDLKTLYSYYKSVLIPEVSRETSSSVKVDLEVIDDICNRICNVIAAYLSGFPSKAYIIFARLMNRYFDKRFQLHVYNKTKTCGLTEDYEGDKLNLFRVRDKEGIKERAEFFHVPKELRHKIKATRFSIEGYPSLYLSTNVELSWNELGRPQKSSSSLFKFNRNIGEERIKVIELAIKPQDFVDDSIFLNDIDGLSIRSRRQFKTLNTRFKDGSFRSTYLYCYPLIAACSFIRKEDSDFKAEYIVPQLLLQWVRKKYKNTLCGIRYFSCKDVASSDKGFNYVFPANNFLFLASSNCNHYCSVLRESFSLTLPEDINGKPFSAQQKLIDKISTAQRIAGIIESVRR